MSFNTESKGKALIVTLVKPVAYLSMSYLKGASFKGGTKNYR